MKCARIIFQMVILARCEVALAQTPSGEEKLPLPKAIIEPSPIPAVLPVDTCEPPPPPKIWCGSFDFGGNGSSGNANNFNLRLFTDTKRELPDSIWTANILYTYGSADSMVNMNRLLANTRYEWLRGPSPWSYWVSGGAEYDEFRAFDLLVFAHSGWGYAWWKNDDSLLKTRLGFGGSYPIGGPEEVFTPEALLGIDYEQKLWDRSKFVLSGVLYPDLGQWFEFRAEGRAAVETVIDPVRNIGLKVGVNDRYVSQPQGRRPNDLGYFAALTWKY